MIKNGIVATLITFCLAGNAEQIDNHSVNVIKIDESPSGSLKVKCSDKSKGVISFEELNICIHSKSKKKNICHSEVYWTIEEAAEYICTDMKS